MLKYILIIIYNRTVYSILNYCILLFILNKMSKQISVKNKNYNINDIVTVKFHTDANETLTQAFDLKTDVGTLRSYLHELFNIDLKELVIEYKKVTLEDNQTLESLGATSLGTFELDLRGNSVQLPCKPAYYLPVVDVITVNVNCKPQKSLVVEIERCSVDKPWLGGYRNRKTNKEYHHSTAQTDFRPKIYLNKVQESKWSQTCADKGIGRDAVNNAWTQTCTSGIQEGEGKMLQSKLYKSYQTWLLEDYVLNSVLKIQRAFRSTLARRKLIQQQKAAAIEQRNQSMAMTSQPSVTYTVLESKQQNFYSLYTMIGKWWKKERQRIREIEAENSRKAAQMNLLKKEIKFLLEMEKQRSELKYELTKHDDITFLNKTSKPKMFKNKTGKLLTMDTVGNQKARVLKEIYAKCITTTTELQELKGSVTEGPNRVQVLDELYTIVSESSYKYKKDLLDAIGMEKDLIAMQADTCSVQSVRARVEQMFRHFIRQPEVNPEADSYYRPNEKRVLNVYTCIRCKRNLAATDFSLESRVNRTNVCANCEWTEQVGHKHIDMAPYRRILKALRHEEMQMAAYESECFLMQPTEVYRLVSVVWREKSALGESSQLNGLRLVRWRQNEPWSPWNCILLTRSEAEAHCRLEGDPADCYDEQFVQWITNRHMTARLQFSNLVQAVKNRKAKKKVKPLSKNWKTVADNFNIKTVI